MDWRIGVGLDRHRTACEAAPRPPSTHASGPPAHLAGREAGGYHGPRPVLGHHPRREIWSWHRVSASRGVDGWTRETPTEPMVRFKPSNRTAERRMVPQAAGRRVCAVCRRRSERLMPRPAWLRRH